MNNFLRKSVKCYVNHQGHENKLELIWLKDYFKHNEFFKDIESLNGDTAIMSCFKSMKIMHKKPNELVFKYADVGDLFYVILKGTVGIKVPTELKLNLNDFEFWQYVNKFRNDILFEKTEIEESLLKEINKKAENKKLHRSDSLNFNTEK